MSKEAIPETEPLLFLPQYHPSDLERRLHEQRLRRRRVRRTILWSLCSLIVIFHLFPLARVAFGNLFNGNLSSDGCQTLSSSGSDSTFHLPLDAETLLFKSEGRGTRGEITFRTSSSIPDGQVLVHVSSVEPVRDGARVCQLEHGNTAGLDIITVGSSWWGWHKNMKFNIQVLFPESTDPIVVNSIQTRLVNYKAKFALDGPISFNHVDIVNHNGKIISDSLLHTGRSLHILNSNGPISGKFNSSGTLVLETSNGDVDVDIGLESAVNPRHATTAIIKTSNAKISAVYDLVSKDSNSGGQFRIISETSNGDFDLKIASAPVDSDINIDADSSNARGEVDVGPEFEGKYILSTSNADVNLEISDVKDPAGRGRERQVNKKFTGYGHAIGTIGWSDDGAKRGHIVAKSSNRPVVLRV